MSTTPASKRKRTTAPLTHESIWQGECYVCGAPGDLVCCAGCPAVAHPECVKFFNQDDDFWCAWCEKDQCGACGLGRLRFDDHVVCDTCGRCFHLNCVGEKTKKDDWLCESCEDAKEAVIVPKKKSPGVKKALAELREARGAKQRAVKWLALRDAKVLASKKAEKVQVHRLRLLSLAASRSFRPTADETFDLTRALNHPGPAFAPTRPSNRYLASWAQDDLDNDEPRSKEERQQQRLDAYTSKAEGKDGKDPDVRAALEQDPAFRDLVDAVRHRLNAARKPVLTFAFTDFLGTLRAVACADLLELHLQPLYPDLTIDVIHLELTSTFRE